MAAVALLAALATVLPAGGAGVSVATNFRYVPGDDHLGVPLEVRRGSVVVFVNADVLAPHTLTAREGGPDGRPLFDTGAEVQPGEARPVEGVEALPPGEYGFYCKLHSAQMSGTLRVI